MILTCSISDDENNIEKQNDIIRNVMVIIVDKNGAKKRYFLGDEPKINSNNLFAFDVKYSTIFKSIRDENDDIFYEKFKNLKADSLNVSNLENNSVVESLISKEDNFINSDVLNLINSPMTSERKNNVNQDTIDFHNIVHKKKLDLKKQENLIEALTDINKEINKNEFNQNNSKQNEEKNININIANKTKADFSKELITDEEKEMSSMDSFNSDLSQSKNYIAKETFIRRNSQKSQTNVVDLRIKCHSPHYSIYNNNNLKSNSVKKGEINSNVINYYDFDKILNDSLRHSPKKTNTILKDAKSGDLYSQEYNKFANENYKLDSSKSMKNKFDNYNNVINEKPNTGFEFNHISQISNEEVRINQIQERNKKLDIDYVENYKNIHSPKQDFLDDMRENKHEFIDNNLKNNDKICTNLNNNKLIPKKQNLNIVKRGNSTPSLNSNEDNILNKRNHKDLISPNVKNKRKHRSINSNSKSASKHNHLKSKLESSSDINDLKNKIFLPNIPCSSSYLTEENQHTNSSKSLDDCKNTEINKHRENALNSPSNNVCETDLKIKITKNDDYSDLNCSVKRLKENLLIDINNNTDANKNFYTKNSSKAKMFANNINNELIYHNMNNHTIKNLKEGNHTYSNINDPKFSNVSNICIDKNVKNQVLISGPDNIAINSYNPYLPFSLSMEQNIYNKNMKLNQFENNNINNYSNKNSFQQNTIKNNNFNALNNSSVNNTNNINNMDYMNHPYLKNNLNMQNLQNQSLSSYTNKIPNPNFPNYFVPQNYNNENYNNIQFPQMTNYSNYMVKNNPMLNINQNYFNNNYNNSIITNVPGMNLYVPNQKLIGNNNTNNINNNIFCNPNIVITNDLCDNSSNKNRSQMTENIYIKINNDVIKNNNNNNENLQNINIDNNQGKQISISYDHKNQSENKIKSDIKKEKKENKQKTNKKTKIEKRENNPSSINVPSTDSKIKFQEEDFNTKKFKEDEMLSTNYFNSNVNSQKISNDNKYSCNNLIAQREIKAKENIKQEAKDMKNNKNKNPSKNNKNNKKISKIENSSHDLSGTDKNSCTKTLSANDAKNRNSDNKNDVKQIMNLNKKEKSKKICNQNHLESENNSISNNEKIIKIDNKLNRGNNNFNLDNNNENFENFGLQKNKNKKKTIKTIEYLNMNDEELSHVAIFICRDQSGCRYLQKKIEDNYNLGSELIYPKIKEHILSLVNDTFGNYLVQKILDNIHQDKLFFILQKITPKFLEIGNNQFGTRIIQKIIENLKDENNLNYFNKLLESCFVDFIKDINGNHIIQKYLCEIATPKNQFLYDVILNQIIEVSTDKFGCCVIQKFIDAANENQKSELIKKIIDNAIILMSDPYGNYVVQYILSLKDSDVIYRISNTFKSYIIYLSKQKFSSNVIEKCFDYSDEKTKLLLIKEICVPKTITELILDAFGNYIIQKALHYCKEPYYTIFVNTIGPILEKLKFQNFGHKLYIKLINTYPELNSYVVNNDAPKYDNQSNVKGSNNMHFDNYNNFNSNNNFNISYKNNQNDIRKKNNNYNQYKKY